MALLGSDTQVTGPFPRGVLLLETLAGEEALGRPFRFELGLLSQEPYLDPDLVLGQPLAVGLKLASGAFRSFHGVVTSFGKEGVSQRHTRYAATLEPAFAQLAYSSECRIFGEPGQTALDIVTTVLSERAATPFEAGAVQERAFRARELCVQYRESDLHFVQRLLEEEGLYYFFRHEEGKDLLVLADGLGAHAPASGYELVAYAPKERHVAGAEEHFWQMRVRQGLGPGQHTVLAGYDATALRRREPHYGGARSEAPAPGSGFEHYDYPGGLFDPEEASREAGLRLEADYIAQTFVEVEGNTVGLGVGDLVAVRPVFAIDENVPFWRPEDYGKQHLVVAASYRLSIDQYETGEVAGVDEGFVGTYQLLDTEHAFRPARSAGKPRMGGPQTALVVGPASEEIWTDALGRVRIQFDWDRLGGKNEKSTCWVRTAHAWAGPQWGGQHIPRIGQEVLVRFLDGDPDRPIVAGSLYSADNLPPYGLPSDATQSGIKSRSSKGGTAANYNELRFEDKQGAEELHLQAERDMSTVVKHCQTLHVGADRSILVGNDETNLVKANRDLTMQPDREETPPGKDTVVIKGAHDKTIVGPVLQIYADDHSRRVDGEQELVEEKNKNEHVKQAFTLTTDKKFQLNQGDTSLTFRSKNVTLDSAGEVVVTAGGATVSMDQAGLTTFESPAGITLTCGASSIAVTPGGVAIAAPAFTMAAGGGSKMSLGADAVAISSKKVAIEADGVCKLRGKKALKLQESEKAKGKKASAGGGAGEKGGGGPGAKARRAPQRGAVPSSSTLVLHVVDLDGKPLEALVYEIKKPDGGTEKGNLDKDGRGLAKSGKPGRFVVRFPELDAGDWEGDGTEIELEPPRAEASRHKVRAGERVPGIARETGFLNWRTIWGFSGNAALKSLRENPNVLWEGDEVAIPGKLDRQAEVVGGSAEYTVLRQEETWISVRPLDCDLEPLDGIRYQAQVGDPEINRGIIPPDGFVVLQVPPEARRGTLLLFESVEEEGPPLEWRFEIQPEALQGSTRDEAQRLVNLGLGIDVPKHDQRSDDQRLALLAYREHVGEPRADDDATAAEMVAMHDGAGTPNPDDGTPQGMA